MTPCSQRGRLWPSTLCSRCCWREATNSNCSWLCHSWTGWLPIDRPLPRGCIIIALCGSSSSFARTRAIRYVLAVIFASAQVVNSLCVCFCLSVVGAVVCGQSGSQRGRQRRSATARGVTSALGLILFRSGTHRRPLFHSLLTPLLPPFLFFFLCLSLCSAVVYSDHFMIHKWDDPTYGLGAWRMTQRLQLMQTYTIKPEDYALVL